MSMLCFAKVENKCSGTVSSRSQSKAYGVKCSEIKARQAFCHLRNSGV